MKAVVLLSGGLDSTVVAAEAVRLHGAKNVGAITMLYGQKHAIELEAARQVAEWMRLASHDVFDLKPIFDRAGESSTLVEGGAAIPHLTYEELEQSEGPSATYVPLRNPVFIAVAASRAMQLGAEELWVGVHGEDAARDAYPDCRADCIGALASSLFIGSYGAMRLYAPLNYLTKAEVVRKGDALGAPFVLTHSCYEGSRPACGKCPTCLGRLAAFESNGLKDPIAYA